jgi:iron complex transport system substrate-binding protein
MSPSAALGPQRIVCLTEETTEWLYLLGEERRIVGISGYTVRPRRARAEKPKISAFLSAKIEQIVALQPDCVFGFSDLQAEIASELIRKGIQVTVFNQRSVEEIFSMLYQVAAMVGQAEQGAQRIAALRQGLADIQVAAAALPRRLAGGAGGATPAALRDQVRRHPAARASCAHRWRGPAASPHHGLEPPAWLKC